MAGKQTQPTSFITTKVTERELDALRLLVRGLANSEVVEKLYPLEERLYSYLSPFLDKLELGKWAQASVIPICHNPVSEGQEG